MNPKAPSAPPSGESWAVRRANMVAGALRLHSSQRSEKAPASTSSNLSRADAAGPRCYEEGRSDLAGARPPCIWTESVWVPLDGGRSAVRRSGLGFLGTSRFAAKTLGFEGCKSLDFLGFSRSNLDLSICYRRFSVEDFSSTLCRRESDLDPTIRHAEAMIVHGTSLALFLLFCNKLPPEPVPSDCLHPKANRSSPRPPRVPRA
jgi:hypothetical protein